MNAAEAALREWALHVEEPPGIGWRRIDVYIQGAKGLHWAWVDRAWGWVRQIYSRDGQFQWCGAFAAFCWGVAGLKRKPRVHSLASCKRLWKWTGRRKGNARRIQPHDLRPGDIAVIGPRKGPRSGKHITIVISTHEGYVRTVEGNATGRLPDGGWREGVVKRKRPLSARSSRTSVVLYGVRPLPEDHDGP